MDCKESLEFLLSDEGRSKQKPDETASNCQAQVSGSKAQWGDILHLSGETLHQEAEAKAYQKSHHIQSDHRKRYAHFRKRSRCRQGKIGRIDKEEDHHQEHAHHRRMKTLEQRKGNSPTPGQTFIRQERSHQDDGDKPKKINLIFTENCARMSEKT